MPSRRAARTLTIVGTFAIGGGFAADGYLIVSDQTFLRLFPQRVPGAPNIILLRLAPGADGKAVQAALRARLPAYDSQIRKVPEAIASDRRFQTRRNRSHRLRLRHRDRLPGRADHRLPSALHRRRGPYPGVRHVQGHRLPAGLLRSIVYEEAAILAMLGFVRAFWARWRLRSGRGRYGAAISMTWPRAPAVLLATLAMCAASGAFATRRLKRAEPADLFWRTHGLQPAHRHRGP